MATTLRSEFSCPICKRTTGKLSQILASAGILQCNLDMSHRWNDTQAFYNERPTMDFKPELFKGEPQENYGPLTVSIPLALKKHLEDNFGQQLNATVTAVLSQLSVNTMTISDTDLQRMTERLGKKPANSSELVGLIYAKVCEAQEAREERDLALKDLKAYESMSPGRVVIDLGDQFRPAIEKAQEAGMPVKFWVEKRFQDALKDGWF